MLTGVFAIKEYGGTPGLIEGNAHQVLNQLIGVVIVVIYDALVSWLLLKIIDSRLGLRVSPEVEMEGSTCRFMEKPFSETICGSR